MQLCYVDESGTADTLVDTDGEQQPVIVVAGVSLPERDLTAVTHEWIELKKKFYPSVGTHGHGWLDVILHDIKGARVRKGLRADATRRRRRHAMSLVDGVLDLLERHKAKLIGRIWVKQLGIANKDMSIHGASLQFICGAFNEGLPAGERGMVVVDSQTYQHNHRLAHSVFTQRFGMKPKHSGLVDMPVFGHSDNHAGLQIADFVCSAVLAPVACSVYADGYSDWNAHCDPGYLAMREHFGQRLEGLTFRCRHPLWRKPCSSVIVSDPLGKRGSRLMWGPPTAARRALAQAADFEPATRSRRKPSRAALR